MWQKAVRDAIVQYSDPRALASHFCQKGLLDMKDLDFRNILACQFISLVLKDIMSFAQDQK